MGSIVTTMTDAFGKDHTQEDKELQHTPRYKPEKIDSLEKSTRFTRSEIKLMYRGYKQFCPNGMVDKATFTRIFAQFFPLGDVSNYADHVFRTFDQDDSGTITFEEFLRGLSVMCRGTLTEKIRWTFTLYDNNRDGFITRPELLTTVTAIYDMLGSMWVYPPVTSSTARRHVDRVFQMMDVNEDGEISEAEFIAYCLKSDTICTSIAMFDTTIPED